MAFNFPNAPVMGEEFAPFGGPIYIWDGTKWTGQTTGGGTEIEAATVADTRSAAPDKFFTTDLIEGASAFVTLTDAASIALDWDSAINFSVTLEGNRTLANPTNGQPGTWRMLLVNQDGVGGRTLGFGDQYKFSFGVSPVVSAAAGAVDIISIFCISATEFYLFYNQNIMA